MSKAINIFLSLKTAFKIRTALNVMCRIEISRSHYNQLNISRQITLIGRKLGRLMAIEYSPNICDIYFYKKNEINKYMYIFIYSLPPYNG